MSAYKKDGKYYIKGKIKKDDGSFYCYTKVAKGCTGIKETREYERLFRKQWQDIKVSLQTITFKELGEEYISTLTNVKKVTIRTYQDLLDKSYQYIGDKKINLLNKDILQKFINELQKQYAPDYVNRFYYIVRATLNYAIDNDKLEVNPMTKVHVKTNKDEVKKEMLFWEPDEFNRFIEAVTDKELKTLYIFLYYMGTRRGEALALQWKDIDFSTDTVHIFKTVTYKTKGVPYEITSPKTSNSTRNIPLFKIVKDALLEWKSECYDMYGFCDDFYVFGKTRPLAAERPRKIMIKTIDKINEGLPENEKLKKIRIHDFRHSHASWLINNMGKYDFTDFDIAKRLGDTVMMLHQTYAHQFKDAGRNIISSMENNTPKEESALKGPRKAKYSELIELKELLDMQIITQDEFNIKKKQILGI